MFLKLEGIDIRLEAMKKSALWSKLQLRRKDVAGAPEEAAVQEQGRRLQSSLSRVRT